MERGHCDGPTVESLLAGLRVQRDKVQGDETDTQVIDVIDRT